MNLQDDQPNLLQLCLPAYEQVSDLQSGVYSEHVLTRTRDKTIYLKTVMGRIIHLQVSSDDSVSNIKELITDKEGYPSGELLIYYSLRLLRDGETLRELEVFHDATLHLFLRSQPGRPNI